MPFLQELGVEQVIVVPLVHGIWSSKCPSPSDDDSESGNAHANDAVPNDSRTNYTVPNYTHTYNTGADDSSTENSNSRYISPDNPDADHCETTFTSTDNSYAD